MARLRDFDALTDQDDTKDKEQNRHDCRVVLGEPDFPSIENLGPSVTEECRHQDRCSNPQDSDQDIDGDRRGLLSL